MGHPELLHPALHALPDVVLAVEPQSLRILDVNRTGGAFGRKRDELAAMGLDDLLDMPRETLSRLVLAAEGRPIDVGVRPHGGGALHASAAASGSAAAAAAPCVLVAIRLEPEHAGTIDEIDRIRGVLSGALEDLDRLADRRRETAPPVSSSGNAPTFPPAPPLPELSLAQYVSLCVETELHPDHAHEINARYGLANAAARAALDRLFHDRLTADPALAAERSSLTSQYRTWYLAQQRARSESAVIPAPQPPAQTPAVPPARSPAVATMPSAATGAGAPPKAPTWLGDPSHPPPPYPPRLGDTPGRLVDTSKPTAEPAEASRATAPPPETTPAGNPRMTVAAGDVRFTNALPFKSAEAPELTVEQYAALTVELEAYPDRRQEILGMYGIHAETAWRACENLWAAQLVGDPTLRQRWMKLCTDLRRKLIRS